jgi:hypothetical protein
MTSLDETPIEGMARAATRSEQAPPDAGRWGEGLAYPEWMQRALPAMHDALNGMNRYVGVPALKMGLGRYISNPLTGYLMILRTRGRKSGEMRDAPLGYTISGPEDPGGRYWIVPAVVGTYLTVRLVRGRIRRTA